MQLKQVGDTKIWVGPILNAISGWPVAIAVPNSAVFVNNVALGSAGTACTTVSTGLAELDLTSHMTAAANFRVDIQVPTCLPWFDSCIQVGPVSGLTTAPTIIWSGIASVVMSGPVAADTQTLTLVKGDDYNATTHQEVVFDVDGCPELGVGDVATLYVRSAKKLNALIRATAVSVAVTDALMVSQQFVFVLHGTQTHKLTADATGALQVFEVVVKFADGSQRTIVRGPCVVIDAIRW